MNPLTTQVDNLGVWGIGLFLGTAACSLFLIQKRFKDIGLWASLLWSYVIVYSLFIVEFPYPSFGLLHTAFQARAGQTVVEALVIPMAALLAPKCVLKGIPWLVAGEILAIWIPPRKGLMGWESFDAALVAACIPFVPNWLKAASILTIVTRHANTALIILAAQFLALSIKVPTYRKYWLLVIPGMFHVAHKFHVNVNFDTGDRLRQWNKILDFWWSAGWRQRVIGFGPASFLHLSLLMDKYQAPLWLHAHEDWLQIAFETGMVGLALAVGTVATALKRAWDDVKILSAVFGVCAFAASYHPARFFPSMAIAALVFRLALTKK